MPAIYFFCGFIILFTTPFSTHGQSCIPGPVRNLSVTLARGLSWAPPEENCGARDYLVTIRKEGNSNLLYFVEATDLSVTFLPICESYEFSVVAISTDHIRGLETLLYAKTPARGLDLTIDTLNVTQNATQDIVLTWSMKTDEDKCVDLFRVVVWDEETVVPEDIYVREPKLVITSVAPCMKYEFEVRAVIGPEEEGEVVFGNYTANGAPSAPPTLGSIRQGATTVNITWNLQSYSLNRCRINSLIADATPNFYVSFAVEDSAERVPYDMTITNLTPNSIYLCRIFVVNSAGTSSPLAIALQTQATD